VLTAAAGASAFDRVGVSAAGFRRPVIDAESFEWLQGRAHLCSPDHGG
jgi:hypothetical protein